MHVSVGVVTQCDKLSLWMLIGYAVGFGRVSEKLGSCLEK